MYQKLYILNISELDKIIYEIKQNINFEIINCPKISDFLSEINNVKDDLLNSVILIKNNDLKFVKEKVDDNRICILPKLPVKIFSLLDKINSKLIQQTYDYQSNMIIKDYCLDLNARNLKKNKKILKLTERETEAILHLHKMKKPINIETLQKEVWKYGYDLETHTVETHIYRLRKKIKKKFDDEGFIVSKKDGYLIK